MSFVSKWRGEVAKNAQFSRHGQARAVLWALMLGAVFGLGLAVAVSSASFYLFGWFAIVQVAFHVWEFMFNALFHPKTLSSSDYLLPWQHSSEFLYAFIAAVIEFWLEWYLFGWMKLSRPLFLFALLVVVVFQVIRTVAMCTAASNFTHQIAEHKTESHELVTTGIYAWSRHPAYCGWFWWSIGTQLLLANPICTIGYALAAWRFFDERIRYEEVTLREYFGENYATYVKRVPVGIPFIR